MNPHTPRLEQFYQTWILLLTSLTVTRQPRRAMRRQARTCSRAKICSEPAEPCLEPSGRDRRASASPCHTPAFGRTSGANRENGKRDETSRYVTITCHALRLIFKPEPVSYPDRMSWHPEDRTSATASPIASQDRAEPRASGITLCKGRHYFPEYNSRRVVGAPQRRIAVST